MKKIKRIILVIIGLLTASTQQNPEWIHFNTSNSELPSNTIQAIAIDSNNSKWIGTDNGLAKYDGINWEIFNKSNGLSSNNVTAITIDSNNKVWIVDSLLSCYDGNEWKHYEIPSNTSQSVYSKTLIADSTNTLWMIQTIKASSSENTNGIISFKDSVFTIYDWSSTGIDLRGINCLATKGNDVWIGGHQKLYRFQNNTWKDCTWDSISNSYIKPVITGIDIDSKGDKWIAGYYSRGNIDAMWSEFHLYKLEGENKYYDIPISISISDGESSELKIDKNENKWMGVYWYGLLKYSTDSWNVFNSDNSDIHSKHIGLITVDKNNNKWVASNWYNQGLSVFREDGVILTSVQNYNQNIEKEFTLYQNYPNPFNPTTTIKYTLKYGNNISLKLYDIVGSEIENCFKMYQNAGEYKYDINMKDYPSGVYLYKLSTDKSYAVRKLLLLK